MNTIVNEEGALVVHIPGWLSNSLEEYERLREELEWHQPTVRVCGKEHLTPRLQHAAGDDESSAYTYSGSNIPLNRWNPFLEEVRDAIRDHPTVSRLTRGFCPNSCLVNYYRDGSDNVGWHSDKEVRDAAQSVVTVSLGCTRRFKLRHIETKRVIDVVLSSGDLVLMCGNTQRKWQHTIPKVALSRCDEGRISLTYRQI